MREVCGVWGILIHGYFPIVVVVTNVRRLYQKVGGKQYGELKKDNMLLNEVEL